MKAKREKLKTEREEWVAQWERLLRSRSRFSKQLVGLPELTWDSDGVPANPVPDHVIDDFYTLALNAWHLHDWIESGSAHAHTIPVPQDLRGSKRADWMRQYPWLAMAEAFANSWKHVNVAENTRQLLDRYGRFVVLAPNGHNISIGERTWPAFDLKAYFAQHILAADFVWPKVNPRPLGRVRVTSVSGGPDYTCVGTDGLVFAEGVARDWHRWIETCGCAKAANIPWPKVEELLASGG